MRTTVEINPLGRLRNAQRVKDRRGHVLWSLTIANRISGELVGRSNHVAAANAAAEADALGLVNRVVPDAALMDEAMALATRVAVMDQGKVLQVGTPAEVYEYPRSRYVADFFGTANLLTGTVKSAVDGRVVVSTEAAGDIEARDERPWSAGASVTVAIRPEKMSLSKEQASSGHNTVRGEVWELGYLGNRSIYKIKTACGTELTVFSQNDRRTLDWAIDWGDQVTVEWSPEATVLLNE